MAKDEKNNKSNKKSSGLLVACWFLLLLILLILFFVKKDLITANLEKTDFFGKVFGNPTEQSDGKTDNKNKVAKNSSGSTEHMENKETTPFAFHLNGKNAKKEEAEIYQEATGSESVKAIQEDAIVIAPNNEQTVDAERFVIPDEKTKNNSNAAPQTTKPERSVTVEKPAKNTAESAQTQKPRETTKDAAKSTAQPVKPTQPAQKTETKIAAPQKIAEREATLFFVVIAPDGSVSRKSVKRTLPKSDSPLTDSINALLAGPLPSERAKNCMSLIPEGSKLLGASIKNAIATLDFNEQFEFNGLGVEGYVAQLMQIVYTATEFSTVSSVQFLIEGVKREYLGSEGQWIGTPLSRSSF